MSCFVNANERRHCYTHSENKKREWNCLMSYICQEDMEYLENKYHRESEPFNPFRRYNFHGYAYDASTGLDDAQMREALHTLFESIKDQPHPIVKARAFACVLDNMRIDVNPHDYFVGFYNWNRPLSFIQTVWKKEASSGQERYSAIAKDFNDSGAVAMWQDFDHVIPDWDALLRLGFPGLRDRAEEYRRRHAQKGTLTAEQESFFDAIRIEYDAILRLLDRLYAYALAHDSEKSGLVAGCLKDLRDGAPQNTFEALQAIYIFFMLCEHVDNYQTRSLGNGLDCTLYPFYRRDLDSGCFTKEQIKTFVAYFLMQYSAIGNYWGHPFYMGGSDAQGNTRINEMSYLLLEVYSQLDIYNPKIQIKVGENTPTPFLNAIFDRIRSGRNSYVFCCEPGYIKAVMSYGASLEEAVNFEVSGCLETRVKADESSTLVGYVNALKAVMLALRDGYDERTDKVIGVRTGSLDSITGFAAFYGAFLSQWANLIDKAMEIGSAFYDPMLSVVNPSIMYSATIERSLERAVDGYAYGCKFNNSALLNCGFASAVDALMAVKTLVFDEKIVTLAQLNQALEKNWEGYELLRVKALRCKHKYGNGDPVTDLLAADMAQFFAQRVNHKPNGRGGVYKALLHSARMFIEHGEKLGATPDGRRAGEEESKNASPSVGMDKKGTTALVRSALTLKPSSYCEGFCLDLMLHPSSVEGDEGLVAMKALLDTYMKNDGMAVQFNVLRAENLRDAQLHPEKYRNLQVRVSGWNVLWSNLDRKEQDAYILRAEAIKR